MSEEKNFAFDIKRILKEEKFIRNYSEEMAKLSELLDNYKKNSGNDIDVIKNFFSMVDELKSMLISTVEIQGLICSQLTRYEVFLQMATEGIDITQKVKEGEIKLED